MNAIRRFFKNAPTYESSVASVTENLKNRDRNFLRILEVGVYENPNSPYLALLKHAGHSLEDVRSLVDKHGLEGALRILRDDGRNDR